MKILPVFKIVLLVVPLLFSCGISFGPEGSPSSFTTAGPPSNGRLAFYDVEPPEGASNVAYWSNEGWMGGALWVKFTTDRVGLESFLQSLDIDPADLQLGFDPISPHDKEEVGWDRDLEQVQAFSGYRQSDGREDNPKTPGFSLLIDESRTSVITVYVLSIDV